MAQRRRPYLLILLGCLGILLLVCAVGLLLAYLNFSLGGGQAAGEAGGPGQGAAGVAPTATPTPVPPSTVAPVPSIRTAQIKSVEGTVEIRDDPEGDFRAAAAEEVMTEGQELRTGADGKALLALDDGTLVAVAEESSFTLTALEGTPETPITRLFLLLGQLFGILPGDLPEGAVFEIETPNGVATVRGTMIGVSYFENKVTEVTCLTGRCAAAIEKTVVDLKAGEWVGMGESGFSDVAAMTLRQKYQWNLFLDFVTLQGFEMGIDIEPGCSCSGSDLTCADGNVVSDFPTCTRNLGCVCQGSDLVCRDGNTYPNDPMCGGLAQPTPGN